MSRPPTMVLFEHPLNEKEKQHHTINGLLNYSSTTIDSKQAKLRLTQIEQHKQALISAPRLGQGLREVRLISVVKQRLNIPGGCCSFDLPTLHLWLHQSAETHQQQINQWLLALQPLKNALYLLLELIRHHNTFSERVSVHGFYQGNADNADLLRLQIPLTATLYPQISAHKTRYAIRFLPLDERNMQIPEQLAFQLACC